MDDARDETERFQELVDLARTLRAEGGCPWDRAQTFESMRRYLLEETHEVLESVDDEDHDQLREELGDLLFLVLFYLILAEERGLFRPTQVLEGTIAKMRRRHPHVFGDRGARDEEEAFLSWESAKRQEKYANDAGSILDGIPRTLPALTKARRMQERAGALGFDWEDVSGPLEKLEEEMAEFRGALREGQRDLSEAELGDVLFSLVNVARLLDYDPEACLERTNAKFRRRFAQIENQIAQSPRPPTLDEMDRLWDEVKRRED